MEFDVFAPVIGGLILLVMVIDHSLLCQRIDKLEREVRLWELSGRYSGQLSVQVLSTYT